MIQFSQFVTSLFDSQWQKMNTKLRRKKRKQAKTLQQANKRYSTMLIGFVYSELNDWIFHWSMNTCQGSLLYSIRFSHLYIQSVGVALLLYISIINAIGICDQALSFLSSLFSFLVLVWTKLVSTSTERCSSSLFA